MRQTTWAEVNTMTRRWLSTVLAAVAAIALLLPLPESATADGTPAEVGNVLLTIPDGWQRGDQRNVGILTPPGVPAGKIDALRILPGEELTTNLRAWFDVHGEREKHGSTVVDRDEVRAQEPTLKTDRQVYAPKDQIIVEFSGLPGNQTDWITVVDASWEDTAYGGQWSYTKGSRSGTMKFVAGSPGKYEVRVYYNYPQGGKVVQSRFAFKVMSGAVGTAPQALPRQIPPPSRPSATSVTPPRLDQQSVQPRSSGRTGIESTEKNAGAVLIAPGATPVAQTPASKPGAPHVMPMLLEEADYWAVRLAKQVQKGGKNVVPDLVRAMQLAGITVCGSDGRIVAEPLEPTQNIVFADAEVAQMALMVGKGMTVPIEGLSDGLSSAIPELAGVPLPAVLIDGIRTKANADTPTLRFWARFIVELGRQSPDSYDLLGQVDAARVRLNSIQMALVLQRLSADLVVRAVRAKLSGSFPRPAAPVLRTTGDAPQLLFANYNRGNPSTLAFDTSGGALPEFVGMQDQPRLPGCEWAIDRWYLPNNADEVALGIGYGFDKFMDVLEKSEKWAKNLGRNLAIANTLLAYVKVVWIMASFDVTIEMDGAGPLIRTPDRKAGQYRQLTATVRMNTGNAQFVNCLRQTLNTVGIDVDLPVNGPLKGAGVGWDGGKGFTSVDTRGDWAISGPLVEFDNPGPRVQEQNKNVDDRDISTIMRMRTDDNGKSHIGIHGAPQKKILDPLLRGTLVPIGKEFSVGVNVQVEPPTIRSTMVDAAAFRGGPAVVLTLPVELFLKSHWMLSPNFTFPLTDWEPCAEGWVGTIEVTSAEDTSSASTTYNNVNRMNSDQLFRQSTFVLHGGVTKIGRFLEDMPAAVVTRIEENHFEVQDSNWKVLCSPKNNTYEAKVRHVVLISTESGGCSSTTSVRMSSNTNGRYVISGTPGQSCPTTKEHQYLVQENQVSCQFPGPDHNSAYSRKQSTGGLRFEVEGQFDPKRPGVIDGTTTNKDMYGKVSKVKWSLRRCK